MQCATFNHAMRQVWRMRHRLATPGLDNIDAVFGLNCMVRDSSRAQFISAYKRFGRKGGVFSCSTIITFQDSYGRNCPLHNECILNVDIKVYMHWLYQCWFLKKKKKNVWKEAINWSPLPPLGNTLFVTLRKLVYFSQLTFL